MEFMEFSAKTVNDCITNACQKFVVTSDKLEYEVVTEGSTGFLGFNSKPAVNYNTYNVVFISGGIAQSMKAVKSTDYNIVIAIRGDEKYISGKGTSSNPYIIGESK